MPNLQASIDSDELDVRASKLTNVVQLHDFVASHKDTDTTELFGITQLCKEFNVTPRALRFYEDKGLLTPMRINSTRVYTRRDRARLTLVLRARSIGSSLNEIKHYLDLYGQQGEGRLQQLNYVIQRTDDAIADLMERRSHIDQMLAELQLINDASKQQISTLKR